MIPEIKNSNIEKIHIKSELSFNTVVKLAEDGCKLIEKTDKLIFDLNDISFADNAGVALLIFLARYAKKENKMILFVNLSKQLMSLIEASGLKNILPINNN